MNVDARPGLAPRRYSPKLTGPETCTAAGFPHPRKLGLALARQLHGCRQKSCSNDDPYVTRIDGASRHRDGGSRFRLPSTTHGPRPWRRRPGPGWWRLRADTGRWGGSMWAAQRWQGWPMGQAIGAACTEWPHIAGYLPCWAARAMAMAASVTRCASPSIVQVTGNTYSLPTTMIDSCSWVGHSPGLVSL